MRLVKVVVGIIKNDQQQFLIAKRPPRVVMPDYWEFPGGKVEHAESHEEALARELMEEIGIVPDQSRYLTQLTYQYHEREIELNIFLVNKFIGQPFGKEGQEIRWVFLEQFKEFEFLPSNAALLAFLSQHSHAL